MKQLTKEQLTDVVYNNWEKVVKENSVDIGERLSNFINDSEDLGEIILKLTAAYGAEIRKECCKILIDTLSDIFCEE